MQKITHADRTQAFLDICHQHQLKVTPQRVAIYQELLKSDTHPTADSVYQIVKREYPNISYDTVNRTLLTFAKIGVVDVVETFGGAKRFDPNVANHHHLHCTQCGKIIDFQNQVYDNLKVPEGISDNFQVISKRVVLKGLCKTCLK
ncbi:MAG: transcriptional repressor [Desulfobacterales bacterium]|jgi:Fur family peroxide stress response transcriptional regulator